MKLDDRIKTYLPDVPTAWDRITIFNLLTHTSGIPNFTAFADYNTVKLSTRSADDAARHHQWEADPTCAPPGGESLAAVQARVVACMRDLAERHAGAAVVLVSHVGPIKALVCTALDVPLTTGQRLFLDSATVSVIDWGAHAVPWEAPAIVRLVNAHHHLGWTTASLMHRPETL